MSELNFGDCIGCGLCILGCPAYEETGFDLLTARGRNKALQSGLAATEMTEPMAQGAFQADGSVRPEPRMDVAHVAEAVVYMANLPLSANVQFMTLMATKMPFIGRG